MEHIVSMHKIRFAEIGIIGSFITYLYGGWNEAMNTLLIFMAIDYITGWCVALAGKSPKTKNGRLNSKVGFVGLMKKGMMMLMLIVAYRLDLLINTDGYVKNATCIAFILNETVSIVENISKFIKMPPVIQEVIDFLKAKNSKDNQSPVQKKTKKKSEEDEK